MLSVTGHWGLKRKRLRRPCLKRKRLAVSSRLRYCSRWCYAGCVYLSICPYFHVCMVQYQSCYRVLCIMCGFHVAFRLFKLDTGTGIGIGIRCRLSLGSMYHSPQKCWRTRNQIVQV